MSKQVETVPVSVVEGTSQADRVHHERDRVSERPDPQGRPGSRSLPERAGRVECVYLAVMALDPTGKGRARWTQRWKQALNAFDIRFDGRLSSPRTA
ncbi:MAG: hypothetical protein QM619_13015 [Micropruina sp.]